MHTNLATEQCKLLLEVFQLLKKTTILESNTYAMLTQYKMKYFKVIMPLA